MIILASIVSAVAGGLGTRKYFCPPAKSSGKVEEAIDRFIKEQAVFTAEVRGAHAAHAKAIEGLMATIVDQTKVLQEIGKGIALLLERTGHK